MAIRVKFTPGDSLNPVVQIPKRLVPLTEAVAIGEGTKLQQGFEPTRNKDKTQEILGELNDLIGLISVKRLIFELQAFVEIKKRREKEKLLTEPLVLHMIFKGNPGTGKTSVARIVSQLFKEMDILQKGHLVECERADLVGEYIGHTAQKTREHVKKALGGVLFIDEAYSLARGGDKDFGKEAIDALVKAMEDQKNNFILILAGYQQEMEWFLQTNPGLRSRFPIHIDFVDYSLDELLAIGESMFKARQYEMTGDARDAFCVKMQGILKTHPYAGNARLVRNMVEQTVRKQAVRLYRKANSSRDELIQIQACDLVINEPN